MVLKTKCELPNHGIFISPQGIVTSCCVSMQNPFGDMNKEECSKIWNNNTAKQFRNDFSSGNIPVSCSLCVKNNHNIRISKSKRINELKTKNSKIVHADITLGNMCQLTCTMCGPTWSHTWAKLQADPSKIWYLSKEKMYEILDTIKGVKDVEIKGGEPFFMPYFDEFINELHKQNPDVTVNILTNGLHINANHIEQLKKLDRVNIGVSAEATGDLYQYIRGGKYNFSQVLENIKILKKELNLSHLHLSSTLSFYNITKWVQQHEEIQNILHSKFNLKVKYSCNVVEEPIDQSIYLTSRTVRKQWLNDLKNSSINLNSKNYKHILEDRPVDITREKIISKIKYYDKIRSMQLEKIVPNVLDTLDEKYI